MPTPVQQQPQAWWRALTRSAHRLAEATRRGAFEEMRPRTVGEEALLHLASRQWMIDAAHHQTDLLDLTSIHRGLPAHRDDNEWMNILPTLTGDTDVAIVWADDYLTAADPTDTQNRQLGIGNYLPEAWHRLFERDVRNLPTLLLDAD